MGDYNCTWSPDGTKIAFAEGFAEQRRGVHERTPTGSAPFIDLTNDRRAASTATPTGRPTAGRTAPTARSPPPSEHPVTFTPECTDTGPALRANHASRGERTPTRPTGRSRRPVRWRQPFTYTPEPGLRRHRHASRSKAVDDFGFGTASPTGHRHDHRQAHAHAGRRRGRSTARPATTPSTARPGLTSSTAAPATTSSTAAAATTSSTAAPATTGSTAAPATTASTAKPATTSVNGDDGNDRSTAATATTRRRAAPVATTASAGQRPRATTASTATAATTASTATAATTASTAAAATTASAATRATTASAGGGGNDRVARRQRQRPRRRRLAATTGSAAARATTASAAARATTASSGDSGRDRLSGGSGPGSPERRPRARSLQRRLGPRPRLALRGQRRGSRSLRAAMPVLPAHLLPDRRHRPVGRLLREARLRRAGADGHRHRGGERVHGPARTRTRCWS